MKLKEVIAQLQQFADQMDDDAEFVLFDKTAEEEYRVDVDSDDDAAWQFEILRGDNEVVIEF